MDSLTADDMATIPRLGKMKEYAGPEFNKEHYGNPAPPAMRYWQWANGDERRMTADVKREWRGLTSEERAPFRKDHERDQARFEKEKKEWPRIQAKIKREEEEREAKVKYDAIWKRE